MLRCSSMLRDVPLDISYSYALGATLLEEFYVPALEQATTYDRVAGYFSSAILSHAIAGFAKFCTSENPRAPTAKFRLIVGARLSAEDEALALYGGKVSSTEIEEILGASIVREVERFNPEEMDEFTYTRFQGFSWMLQEGIIEIKVGSLWDPQTRRLKSHNEAEFHTKFGVLSDGDDSVAFTGSANETKRGWLENHESIDVFCSWKSQDGFERARRKREDFHHLWEGRLERKGVLVTSFPEAARQNILDSFPPRNPAEIDEEELAEGTKFKPHPIPSVDQEKDVKKWSHQKEAIEWFFDPDQANGVGIFQMATGAGKTRSAIGVMQQANKDGLVEKTVVCVPKTLEDQWAKEIREHYKENSYDCYWWKSGKDDHATFFLDRRKNSVMIVSYFFVPRLLEYLRKKPERGNRTLLVVDELHHVGSEGYKQALLEPIGDGPLEEERVEILQYNHDDFHPFDLRLGLSATPWDTYDDVRNRYIISGFVNGEYHINSDEWQQELIDTRRVFYFGLKEGIERGILCPFNYVPLPYVPSEKDKQDAKDAFGKVDPSLPEHKKKIMGMILAAKVFKISREKFFPFKEWLNHLIDSGGSLDRCILFVGDTKFGSELLDVLGQEFRITDFRTFFQGESNTTLELFAVGKSDERPEGLDSLIACERISEGLDIKSVDTIVLFCSDNSRLKTIQRIGRALRTDPTNPKKRATVVDFIFEEEGNADQRRKIWLEELAEIRRE